MQLILVRHGNTFEKDRLPVQIGSKIDLDLTFEGRSQIEKLVGKFPISHIYSGPLKRQIQTAQILSKSLPIIHNALNEIDYGVWEGLSQEEILKKWPVEFKNWNENAIWPDDIFKPSFSFQLNLIENFIDELKGNHFAKDTIVAVSSNGLIRLFSHLAEEKMIEKVKTGHFCEFEISDKKLSVKSWNRGG